ncbi:MAG TPA: 2-phospho-L-lactate transferase, partial [Capillimicrobium sp.]
AVSPIVAGRVLKGPTAACLAWAGHEATTAGVAAHYGDLLDGLVGDEPVPGAAVPVHITDVGLGDPAARERVAREVLEFARSLA